MMLKQLFSMVLIAIMFSSCKDAEVKLAHGIDESAGVGSAYIITTPLATYYLEKTGGGLSSMLDKDGVDWIGFHNAEGSAHKGEYRGFPNAVHKQDGSYFHAMNAKTDPSSSVVDIESDNHIQITFTSENKQWQGQWDFYPYRCDFTMTKTSLGYKYWVQYEGVPGGEMDTTDYWYASCDSKKHSTEESYTGDLPSPEWMAFGDVDSPRMLYVLHHEDDKFSDNYVYRTDMTVLGFGRENGEKTTKHLTAVQTFSIGFVESTEYPAIVETIKQVLE